MVKLIQILRAIADKDDYCIEFGEVRNMIWQIVAAFEKASKMGFADEIVHVIYAMTRQEDHISATSRQYLPIVLAEFAT